MMKQGVVALLVCLLAAVPALTNAQDTCSTDADCGDNECIEIVCTTDDGISCSGKCAAPLDITVAVDGESKSATIKRKDLIGLFVSSDGVTDSSGNGINGQPDKFRVANAMAKIATAQAAAEAAQASADQLATDLDTFWLLLGGVLVFFMQPGFALLEAGSVRSKNTKNILFKNTCDACVGALGFWSVGYSFAYAEGNKFIGTKNGFFMAGTMYGMGDENPDGYDGMAYSGWFFQFAFAATAATIVSGAVAERISFGAYLIGTTMITIFIYPVVVHWGWSTYGWASAFLTSDTSVGGGDKLFDVGATDFAGCVIVHMVGGVSALTAMILVGPRIGRFDANGVPQTMVQQSPLLQIFGTFILWFGWYGFNCASTLALSGGAAGIAGKTAVTTTLSPAAACGTSIIIGLLRNKILDCGAALNGILAGLVGITSACSTVEPWAAVVIGMIAALVYHGASMLILKMKLDDVVDAVAVHGCCGIWGCISVALFASERNYAVAYGFPQYTDQTEADYQYGLFYGGGGKLLIANIVFILAVLAWVGSTTFGVFLALKFTLGVRVSPEVEQAGMDVSKHGGVAFSPDQDGVYSNGMHVMVVQKDEAS